MKDKNVTEVNIRKKQPCLEAECRYLLVAEACPDS